MKPFIALSILCVIFFQIYAQSTYLTDSRLENNPLSKDTIIVKAAGPQYQASGWKEFWWGEHYQHEWATPVAFPVLHISKIDGGLTPLKVGGGHESKSLRLLSINGREYVLRTMDKTHDALVPEELKGTFVNDIVNDQVSTSHPYGLRNISSGFKSASLAYFSITFSLSVLKPVLSNNILLIALFNCLTPQLFLIAWIS